MEDQVPNPTEDLKHAHSLLSLMTPEELLKATYALEEIIEDSPRFLEKIRREDEQAASSGWVAMEEVLSDHGLTKENLESFGNDQALPKQTEAA